MDSAQCHQTKGSDDMTENASPDSQSAPNRIDDPYLHDEYETNPLDSHECRAGADPFPNPDPNLDPPTLNDPQQQTMGPTGGDPAWPPSDPFSDQGKEIRDHPIPEPPYPGPDPDPEPVID
jgi:hypothetical protein